MIHHGDPTALEHVDEIAKADAFWARPLFTNWKHHRWYSIKRFWGNHLYTLCGIAHPGGALQPLTDEYTRYCKFCERAYKAATEK